MAAAAHRSARAEWFLLGAAVDQPSPSTDVVAAKGEEVTMFLRAILWVVGVFWLAIGLGELTTGHFAASIGLLALALAAMTARLYLKENERLKNLHRKAKDTVDFQEAVLKERRLRSHNRELEIRKRNGEWR
jgi:hypothetical protein